MQGTEEEAPEAPEGADTLEVPEEEAYPRLRGPGVVIQRAVSEAVSAARDIRARLWLAVGLTILAALVLVVHPAFRFGGPYLILLFWSAALVTAFLGVFSLVDLRRLLALQRRYRDDPKIAGVHPPERMVGATWSVFGGNLMIPLLLFAAFPATGQPLDVSISNATDGAIDMDILVLNEANTTVFAGSFHLEAQHGTATGVIATAKGTYSVNVTVDGNRSEVGWLRVDPSYHGAHITIFEDRIEISQVVE